MSLRRWLFRVSIVIAVTGTLFVSVCIITVQTHRTEISSLNDAPVVPVAIILGAKVKANNQPSDILRDRLLTGIELYEQGKVSKLLLSGDDGQIEYDEVNAMRVFVIDHGIPAEDIFLDHAGFDTYDSMARASEVFGVTSAIIVTQNFHLPRALYLADAFGIEARGISADRQTYVGALRSEVREWFADVKAVIDVTLHVAPTYLGDFVDISGDGRVTWDEGK